MSRGISKFFPESSSIFAILLCSLLLRLFLANFGTLQLDHGTFIAWAGNLANNGFKNFYNGWSDYFPGYLYVLWFLGKVNQFLPDLQTLTFKFPAILSDLVTGFLIYKIIRKEKNEKWAVVASSLYLFNPAIMVNSTLWGQIDSLTALFCLLSVYFLRFNHILSAIFLAIGTLIKPQAAFVLPAFLYVFISERISLRKIIQFIFSGLLVFFISFLPFNNQSNFLMFIYERILLSSGQYPYGSVNAFSLWGLWGFWKPDNLTFWIGLFLSTVFISLVTYFLILKKYKNKEYLLAGISLLITFLFMTRMHERHLLPSLVFLLISGFSFLPSIISYVVFSLTYVANIYYAYSWISYDFKEVFNSVFIGFLILINLSAFFIVLIALFNKRFLSYFSKLSEYKLISGDVKVKKFTGKDIGHRLSYILLFILIIFTLLTRFINLSHPKNEYFDEVYHAFTAKLMLHNDPKAWEWWNPHPEGFAYEWTHPPLAKIGMVLGMKVFGENSFGFRSMQALLGTLSVYLLYEIVFVLFKDKKMALLSASALALEGLFLVMNRIGMNDTYMVFFMVLSFYFFIKKKIFLSSVGFGLAIASKWSAIYFLPILLIAHIVLKNKIQKNYLFFAVVPLIIYISSYTQMFLTGHTWSQFVEVQKQMWWYHTNLDAEHPYTSSAFSWPLLLRPIYLYNGPETDGFVERIYAFGNPFVFWFGLASFFIGVYTSWKEKNKKLGLVIFSYLVFFIPWIASPRIMFLYHYLPSIPFLCILIGYTLRRFPRTIKTVIALFVIAFIYFFPHWTGIRIWEWLDKSFYWLNSWR